MANLASQTISRAGVLPTYAAAAGGGDTFTPGADVFLHVKNAHTGSWVVTVVTPGAAIADVPIADLAVTVPNASERMIGPFPPQFFADPADGLADITYSGVTALTVAVVRLSQP